ncbi:hypothetical protein BSLG_002136 [Batrachochytrium salamandrivorans]|nr:hypothetical protein BSLG_002136 [Batrachochytrium salamandrivorans]
MDHLTCTPDTKPAAAAPGEATAGTAGTGLHAMEPVSEMTVGGASADIAMTSSIALAAQAPRPEDTPWAMSNGGQSCSDSTDSLLATVRSFAAAATAVSSASTSPMHHSNGSSSGDGHSNSSPGRPFDCAGSVSSQLDPLRHVHYSSLKAPSKLHDGQQRQQRQQQGMSHPLSQLSSQTLPDSSSVSGACSGLPTSGSKTTVLDLGDDDALPVASWGSMAKGNVAALVSGNRDDDEDSIDSAAPAAVPVAASSMTKTRRRKKRSPNRDDSDSDDDDDIDGNSLDGTSKNKRDKEYEEFGDDSMDPVDDPNYTPFDDPESVRAGFKVGFSEDRNKKYRRTMEDAHTIMYNFLEEDGSGFFAVFDGHAGKSAADYCGQNLHANFAQLLKEHPTTSIPELLNQTFQLTDEQLSQRKGMHAGCTAIVGYLRVEERGSLDNIKDPIRKARVLYTANVGDSRAVLCRNGTAVRLSHDHKGSDQQESRRILEAGGFVMNSRVNGVLAVTRSLGDLSMKEWVIGSPYTTETVLNSTDTFLILACDGIWDVCSDQQALDIIKDILDPQEAADTLLDYALDNFSTDNLTVVVARLNTAYLE